MTPPSLLPEDQEISRTQAQRGISTLYRKVLRAFRRELRNSGLSEPTVERHVGVMTDLAQPTLLAHAPHAGCWN